MSDVLAEPTVTVEASTLTISYERKIGKPYGEESTTAGFFYKRPLDPRESVQSIADQAGFDYAPLISETLDVLGLTYSLDAAGRIREGAANHVRTNVQVLGDVTRTNAQAIAAVQAAIPGTVVEDGKPTGNSGVSNGGLTVIGKQNGPLPAWLAAAAAKLGATQVLDNRDDNGAARISKNGKSMPLFLVNNAAKDAIWGPR